MKFDKEYISNHGTAQGIWPRFYLQIADLAELAVGKSEFIDRTGIYLQKVIPDLTNLYDIYHKIITAIEDYKTGIESGKYFSVNERGHSSWNRLNEVEISNLTKDFIIRCKITLVNFIKCGITDECDFKISDFYFCDEKKFQNKKQQYIKKGDNKYLPLIDLIENANSGFLNQLNEIRGSIEHNLFSLDKFTLNRTENFATISEPDLQERPISKQLTFYYEKILEFIEKITVYYFGINGEINLPTFLELHIDDEFDFANLNYKYRFSLGGTPWSFTSKRCLYD